MLGAHRLSSSSLRSIDSSSGSEPREDTKREPGHVSSSGTPDEAARASLTTLPPAVALDILERSSPRDLARFELVSRDARSLAKAAFPAIVARMGLSGLNSDQLATELLTAAGSGNIERAQVLLELGASINGRPGVEPPLLRALEMGREAMALFLIGKGADVDARRPSTKEAPLHVAARRDFPKVVLALIDRGANVDAPNGSEETPLFAAIPHLRMVALLLANDADANRFDSRGDYPADRARQFGFEGSWKLLDGVPRPNPLTRLLSGPSYLQRRAWAWFEAEIARGVVLGR